MAQRMAGDKLKEHGIHIDPKNEGKFREAANRSGESVQEHAHKVVNDPDASEKQRKRAQFAINAKKWARK